MNYEKYNTRIIAYNEYEKTGDFSCNVYWRDFNLVLYLDGREYRSTTEVEVEEYIDSYGSPNQYRRKQTEIFTVSIICSQSVRDSLESIGLYDVVKYQKLSSSGTVIQEQRISNITFEDTGDKTDLNSKLLLSFQLLPSQRPTSGIQYVQTETVGWDLTGNGQINSFPNNVEANLTGGYRGKFYAYQVYQNLRASSNITLRVSITRPNGTSSTIAVFNGKIGDLFSNSAHWQSGIEIWRYFNASDKVGDGKIITFDKLAFARDNGNVSTEKEDRSVKLTFELKSTRSKSSYLTLPRVYSIWGAFNTVGVYSSTTGQSTITTIGNEYSSNTLKDFMSFRRPTTPPIRTSDAVYKEAVNIETNNIISRYSIGASAAGERYYEGKGNTNGGYFLEWQRGTYDTDNFTFSLDETFAVTHQPNVLTANGIYSFSIRVKYDRQTGSGGFPDIGFINHLNDSVKVYLNNSLLEELTNIQSNTIFSTKLITVTLPDTEIHSIKMQANTDNGYSIGTEFDCQLKPIY